MKSIALIDGAELYTVSKALGVEVDFRRLLQWLRVGDTVLVRAYYFALYDDDAEFSSIRPLLDWLEYNGYTMVQKPSRLKSDGTRKGSIRVELAVAAMSLLQTTDHFFLFANDSEYVSLVEALKSRGKRVTVVSTISTKPHLLSDALRRVADECVDLNTIASVVEKVKTGKK